MSGNLKEKASESNQLKENGKIYDCLQYLNQELGSFAKIKTKSEAQVLEAITDYYQSNSILWNHNITDYRDRELRDVFLEKLVNELDGKRKYSK